MALLILLLASSGSAQQKSPNPAAFQLTLPTDNDTIFSRDPSRFYMYTYRSFDGVSSHPWTAGRYGFVRNQRRTSHGIIFTRFHEGVDIRPVHRDKKNEPLDDVRSIADGLVVYTNKVSGRSNYGNYLVVQHNWGEGPFYSLYAHFRSIAVKRGDRVKSGTVLGRLGYTGAGINRERAHVHVEFTMMLSERFETWYGKYFRSPNHHSIYSGLNLSGMDIAGLFHSKKENPKLTVAEFVRMAPAYYTVAVPARPMRSLPIAKRYPWLEQGREPGQFPPAWEITLSSSGLPMEIRPYAKKINSIILTGVKNSPVNHSYNTLKRLSGIGGEAKLTNSGILYIQLLTDSF
ncbi:MAG: M23 family metallopeptidase [Verrucomicrobiales bacterium]|nr:M23 family metallopeptidase [Verrucomicrobiales bacterium]